MTSVFENLLSKMNGFLELEEKNLFYTLTDIKETIKNQQTKSLKNEQSSYEAFDEISEILKKNYKVNLSTDFPLFYLHGEKTRILFDLKDYPQNVNINYLYNPDTQVGLTLSNSLNSDNYHLNITMSCFKGATLNYRSSDNSVLYNQRLTIKQENLFNCVLEHVDSNELPDILLINFDIDLSNDQREISSFYHFIKKFNEDMCKKVQPIHLNHKNKRI